MALHVQGFAKPGDLYIDDEHPFAKYIRAYAYICIGKSSAIYKGT